MTGNSTDLRHADMMTTLIQTLFRSSPITFDQANPLQRLRTMLFAYGVIDCYCQASRLPNDQASQVFETVDKRISGLTGISMIRFLQSPLYRQAFGDDSIKRVIGFGGGAYNGFASNDAKQGGHSLAFFGQLITMWKFDQMSALEQKLFAEVQN